MRRWQLFIFLLPLVSLAAEPAILLQPFPGDLSVKLLRSFFPMYDMGGPALMGVLMTILNLGITSIVGIVLGYTVILATVGSAIDSMSLGPKLNLWSVMRIVMGTCMLIPTYNGFTSLQAFILWMVINGVGLADNIWASIIEVIVDTGGTPMSQQQTSYWSDLSTTVGTPTKTTAPDMVSSLALSEVCLRMKYYQSGSESNLATSDTQGPDSYQIRSDGACSDGFVGICYGNGDTTSSCGSYPLNSSVDGLSSALLETAHLVQTGIDGVFDGLYYQAKANKISGDTSAVGLPSCDSTGSSFEGCPVSTYIVSGASNYLTGISTMRSDGESNLTSAQTQSIKAMVSQGWIVAGYYYGQVLGQPKTSTQTPLSTYDFPYKSNSSVPDSCTASTSAEMQVYCYLYDQLNAYDSTTSVQTQALYDQIYDSSAVVNSDPSDPNNMVNDPVINYAVALMINDCIYNVSDSFYKGLGDSFLAPAMSTALVGTGAGFTGSRNTTVSLSAANVLNLALCSVQAVTGIQIFNSACDFAAAHAPDNTNCKSSAVRSACNSSSQASSSTCLTTAVSQGCISQAPSSMGMLGAFYYNQTHSVGQNPLITVISAGHTLMTSAIDSLWDNAKHSLQLMIDAGIGLMILKIPVQITVGTIGTVASYAGQIQVGQFFALTAVGIVGDFLDMGYKMVLFQAKFMFESVVMLNGLLMSFGALFSIYFPAVPMIIYTLGAIGWFAVVIEAMIAAPIIAAGVTYPQGGQFLGSAEQGLSLGFSVFLRPSLMVIGLYMAALIAQISMDITHYTFLYFVAFLLSWTTDPSGLLSVIVMFMVTMIYIYLAFEILSHAYTYISILPDRIMRWFLAGSTDVLMSVNVSNVLSGVKDQAESVGAQMGRATPSAPQGIRMVDGNLIGGLMLGTKRLTLAAFDGSALSFEFQDKAKSGTSVQDRFEDTGVAGESVAAKDARIIARNKDAKDHSATLTWKMVGDAFKYNLGGFRGAFGVRQIRRAMGREDVVMTDEMNPMAWRYHYEEDGTPKGVPGYVPMAVDIAPMAVDVAPMEVEMMSMQSAASSGVMQNAVPSAVNSGRARAESRQSGRARIASYLGSALEISARSFFLFQ